MVSTAALTMSYPLAGEVVHKDCEWKFQPTSPVRITLMIPFPFKPTTTWQPNERHRECAPPQRRQSSALEVALTHLLDDVLTGSKSELFVKMNKISSFNLST